jgi:hypothetical protein
LSDLDVFVGAEERALFREAPERELDGCAVLTQAAILTRDWMRGIRYEARNRLHVITLNRPGFSGGLRV